MRLSNPHGGAWWLVLGYCALLLSPFAFFMIVVARNIYRDLIHYRRRNGGALFYGWRRKGRYKPEQLVTLAGYSMSVLYRVIDVIPRSWFRSPDYIIISVAMDNGTKARRQIYGRRASEFEIEPRHRRAND